MTTLSIQPASNTYNGDGGTDTFAYTFMAFYGVEIIVTVDDVVQTEGTDYTVTGLGDYGGGDIVFEAASIPAAGTDNVVISWDINGIRYIDYSQVARFDADVVNRDINRLWMAFQQHDRGIFDDLTISGDIALSGNQRAIYCDEDQELIISDYPPGPYTPWQSLKITAGTGGAIEMESYDGVIRFHDTAIASASITNGGYPIHYSTVTQDLTIRSKGDTNIATVNGAGAVNINGWSETKLGAGTNFANGYLILNSAAELYTYDFDIINGVLKMGGTQVLTTQGAAVADATGAGDVVAQLNTLLARLRVHGIIAT